MPSYLTPGVYFESADSPRRSIAAVRTDTAGFVGLAERGPLNQPTLMQSWRQFQTTFGSYTAFGYLAYCVKAFFENGGDRCYVVRVAADDAALATGDLIGLDGLPTLTITARSAGRWGNRVQVRLGEGVSAETTTIGTQPPTGDATRVTSIVGFAVGTLVRLTQLAGATLNKTLRVVTGGNPLNQQLHWDSPLPLAGAGKFDLTQPIDLESVTFTLAVYEQGRLQTIYADLSLVPANECYVVSTVVADPNGLIAVRDLHAGIAPDAWGGWLPDISAETTRFKQGVLSLQCGTDGLANLTAADFIGSPSASVRTGLRTFELVQDVSLLAIPDIMIQPQAAAVIEPLPAPELDPCVDPPAPPLPLPLPPGVCPDLAEQPPTFNDAIVQMVQQALVQHCETESYRFAVLDAPFRARDDLAAILQWRQQFDSSYAALFFGWVVVPDPLQRGENRPIPPSGHMSGLIARTDLTLGVHHAPANQRVAWANAFTATIDDGWHGILNPAAVNALRVLPGRGLRLYSARTLSSDSQLRFINVRRTLLLIEQSLELALQWVVFEPNSYLLRQSLTLAVGGLLAGLWQQGALVGRTAEEAYFVRCDDENNPPDLVENGRLVVDIGVAIVQPAEFVIVRIGRTQDELVVTELSGASA
jgi:phage tail sheath protein FI